MAMALGMAHRMAAWRTKARQQQNRRGHMLEAKRKQRQRAAARQARRSISDGGENGEWEDIIGG